MTEVLRDNERKDYQEKEKEIKEVNESVKAVKKDGETMSKRLR